jgi:hypothetical protein
MRLVLVLTVNVIPSSTLRRADTASSVAPLWVHRSAGDKNESTEAPVSASSTSHSSTAQVITGALPVLAFLEIGMSKYLEELLSGAVRSEYAAAALQRMHLRYEQEVRKLPPDRKLQDLEHAVRSLAPARNDVLSLSMWQLSPMRTGSGPSSQLEPQITSLKTLFTMIPKGWVVLYFAGLSKGTLDLTPCFISFAITNVGIVAMNARDGTLLDPERKAAAPYARPEPLVFVCFQLIFVL